MNVDTQDWRTLPYPRCNTHKYGYRRLLGADGKFKQVRAICLVCGVGGVAVKTADFTREEIETFPVFSHKEREDISTAFRAPYVAEIQRLKEVEASQWWESYNTYLQSDAWQAKRRLVLERDKNICQACLKATATQVHHLSYQFVGNEPAWDLRAVCAKCHEEIHRKQQEVHP